MRAIARVAYTRHRTDNADGGLALLGAQARIEIYQKLGGVRSAAELFSFLLLPLVPVEWFNLQNRGLR